MPKKSKDMGSKKVSQMGAKGKVTNGGMGKAPAQSKRTKPKGSK